MVQSNPSIGSDPASRSKELFLVEGESAALAVQRVCNPNFQAVLPMQGKPLNAWKASQAKVAAYPLFQKLLEVLGTELGAGPSTAAEPIEKIIFLFDPDADGIHCSALMLWFFYRWLPGMLEAGQVHAALPPVCELISVQSSQKWHPRNHHEAEKIIAECAEQGIDDLQRKTFRGLASIGSELLAQHCIDPASRKLIRLRPADAVSSLQAFGMPPKSLG
ncbi:MAG: toprim domain-containing protein [Planctomycetota bacterium]